MSNVSNVFDYFIDSCREHLAVLVKDCSFVMADPKYSPPECCVEYRKGVTTLDVLYEFGDFPWIRITVNGKDDSLDRIIKRKCPSHIIKRDKKISDPKQKVDSILRQYAMAILTYELGLK